MRAGREYELDSHFSPVVTKNPCNNGYSFFQFKESHSYRVSIDKWEQSVDRINTLFPLIDRISVRMEILFIVEAILLFKTLFEEAWDECDRNPQTFHASKMNIGNNGDSF